MYVNALASLEFMSVTGILAVVSEGEFNPADGPGNFFADLRVAIVLRLMQCGQCRAGLWPHRRKRAARRNPHFAVRVLQGRDEGWNRGSIGPDVGNTVRGAHA